MNSVIERMRVRLYRFLRSTERYTKTDMVYLTRGGFWLFFGQAMSLIISLGSAVAFANLLPAELYGNYKYILSITGILGTFTLSGLSTALIRSVARGHEGTLPRAFSLMLRWSISMIIGAAAAGTYYLMRGNVTLGFSFFIVGALLPIVSASSLYQAFLSGKKYFRLMSICGDVVQNLLPALAVIGTLLLTNSVIALVFVYFVAQAVTLFTLYRFVLKNFVENNEVDEVFEHLGTHLSVMNIISAVASRLDSILIFQFLGGTDLAVFSFATAMPDQARASMKNITALAVPKFAAKTKEELKKTVFKKSFVIFLVSLFGTVAYIALAPYLFSVFFPHYMRAVAYSQVYAVTIMSSLVLSGAYFEAQVAIREKYILNIISSMTIIISTSLGVIFFGLWGAIVARIVARAVIVTASLLVIWRH